MKQDKPKRRRGRGTGSVFLRKEEGYRGDNWNVRYTDINGRRHRKSGFRSREAAQQALNELLASAGKAETSPTAPAPVITVARLFRLIEYDREINKSEDSLKEVRRRWHLHLEPVFAQLPADKLTTEHVEVYTRGRKAQGAKNATINRELATLKRMYNLAYEQTPPRVQKVPVIPMLSEAGNTRTGFLEDAVYEEMAKATARLGLWLRTMFEIGVTFGWRRSEVLNLKVEQVDLEQHTIRLHTSKNGRPRQGEIVPGSKVEALLGEAVARKKADDYVLTRVDEKGHHHPVRDFRDGWKTAVKAAGVPHLTFHDLRRTAVRNLVRAGVPEKVAMEVSGHRTRAVFERYNIVDQKDVRQAMARLEEDRRKKLRPWSGPSEVDEPLPAALKVN